eukprot:jgi/Pico_ML_1/52870/g3511.t1
MSTPDAQMEMLKQSLQAAFQANAVVVILVLLGVAATLKGVFDSRGISDLGRLVYHVSLPSLLFYNIMYEVTWDRCCYSEGRKRHLRLKPCLRRSKKKENKKETREKRKDKKIPSPPNGASKPQVLYLYPP